MKMEMENKNDQVEQVEPVKQVKQETIKLEESRKQLSNLEGPRGTKHGHSPGAPLGKVIGAVITVGVLGFWFGFGAAL